MGEAWLAHCYGMVGAGRDVALDSGSGAELYAVTGHAPRHLDRNIALIGRIVQGIELLSTLPRGTGPLGFYEQPAQRVPVVSMRVAADLPVAERLRLEVMRTDTAAFAALVESRRNRRDDSVRAPRGARRAVQRADSGAAPLTRTARRATAIRIAPGPSRSAN